MEKWQTPEKLRELLVELVSWESSTLTEGEKQFPIKLKEKLQKLSYFQNNPQYLEIHDVDLGRSFVTALYKHPNVKETICLISHFDTVPTKEYGEFEKFATKPEELTKLWQEQEDQFSGEIAADLKSGEYLFGRGTMDMKMGLALHLSLLEKASTEKWPINLLLLTVPDEEVNSTGMRLAVPKLVELQQKNQLDYRLFLNSEPVFTNEPRDRKHHLYTGSIGKVLVGSLFYGKESHAGEPLRGVSSPFIASYLTREMEWNAEFQEIAFSEKTPLPVTLQQTDLNLSYSTQTPYRSAALYNIFLFNQSASDVFSKFEDVAKRAASQCNKDYKRICKDHHAEMIGEIKVIPFKDLFDYAENKLGKVFVETLSKDICDKTDWDDREKSIRIADQLMIFCQELAPAIIIMLVPPYYPAVNSTDHPLIKNCSAMVIRKAKEKFHLTMDQIHYFNGICDLSYVNFNGKTEEWKVFEENSPCWGETYFVPFQDMKKLQAPVLNLGPYGKDPHKRTERLHIQNAFVETPFLLEELIKGIIDELKLKG